MFYYTLRSRSSDVVANKDWCKKRFEEKMQVNFANPITIFVRQDSKQ